jgi:hypothetical protein
MPLFQKRKKNCHWFKRKRIAIFNGFFSLRWLKNENVREIINRPVDEAVHGTSHAL